MVLMYKQLTKQILKNKIFVILLLILTLLTSLSFFFVKFSIDGNLAALNAQSNLTDNQALYKNALHSNTSLAYTFLMSLTVLTAFVFVMFFYRFFRSNRKQIGCLKSLGFKDKALGSYFVVFVAALSIVGALLGIVGGYFMSSILVNANMQTYKVTGLIKSISLNSVIIGLMAATAIFMIVAYICYGFVRGKEPGRLIAGDGNKPSYKASLRVANVISRLIPVKDKAPLRIALRKPVAVFLVFVAVMAFSVCIILGQSLNISSQKVMESQTTGHNYPYELVYDNMQNNVAMDEGTISYLELDGVLFFQKKEIEHSIIAHYNSNKAIFALQGQNQEEILLPSANGIVIGPGLVETYGLNMGDMVTVVVDGRSMDFHVTAIAANAKTAGIYMEAAQLTHLAGLPAGSFNGELRKTQPVMTNLPAGTQIITQAERKEELARNAVSNNVSGVINQATGILIGCILIFLALYVNFQDNTRDMLILHLMGYRNKAIRKILVNVYQPIVWVAFLITFVPSIWLAKTIQRSLSITTNDYMPFGTNIWVMIIAFVVLNIIYLLVQTVFSLGIKQIVAKGETAEYTMTE